MKGIIAFIIFVLSTHVYAGGFYVHIKDAIKLNKERALLYAGITNGRSKIVSKGLIGLEYATVPISKYYDFRAKKYNKAGIPLFKLDFIDMAQTPAFKSLHPLPARAYRSIRKLPIYQIEKELKLALKENDLDRILEIATQQIEEINENPSYNCLTRHFLESIRRSAFLLPYYIEASHHKDLSSPKNLVKQVILIQAKSLPLVQQLDREAGPIQEKGIAILCQDVPHIPLPSEQEIATILSH